MFGREFIGNMPHSRRHIRLGGSNVSLGKGELIRKAQEERIKRMDVKRRTDAATCIQTHWRSVQERRRWTRRVELEWPRLNLWQKTVAVRWLAPRHELAAPSTISKLQEITMKLLVFDEKSGLYQFQSMYITSGAPGTWNEIGSTFIICCIRLLLTLDEGLRHPVEDSFQSLLEKWINSNSFTNLPREYDSSSLAREFQRSIVSKGFFAYLRQAIDLGKLEVISLLKDASRLLLLEIVDDISDVYDVFRRIFTVKPPLMDDSRIAQMVLSWPLADMIRTLVSNDEARILFTGLDTHSAVFAFANIVKCVSSLLPTFNQDEIGSYTTLLLLLVSPLSLKRFMRLFPASMTAADDAKEFKDSDDEFGPTPSDKKMAIPEEIASSLRVFFSNEHFKFCFRAITKRDGSIAFSLVQLLVKLFHLWPDYREPLLASCNRTFARTFLPIAGKYVIEVGRAKKLDILNQPLSRLSDVGDVDYWNTLWLLAELYARWITAIGDDEFFDSSNNPLTIPRIVQLSNLLRDVVFAMYWYHPEQDIDNFIMEYEYSRLVSTLTKVLRQLRIRDSRRRFIDEGGWIVYKARLSDKDIQDVIRHLDHELGGEDESGMRNVGPRHNEALLETQTKSHYPPSRSYTGVESPRLKVLREIPFVIPFMQRVKLFREIINNDRARLSESSLPGFSRNQVPIRRGHVFEDGFAQLNARGLFSEASTPTETCIGASLKRSIQIQFIDQHGFVEMGIDGGGVFKEFLNDLIKEAFDPNCGLFVVNEEQMLYPSPSPYASHRQQLAMFEFLGRMLGKALYEGILVDVRFASFFLNKWLGRRSYIDDLPSLDKELYKGLMFLKSYKGNAEDLALSFTVNDYDFGEQRTKELIRNGSSIAVTDDNKMRYILMVAHYRLNVQIDPQCRAFLSGLSDLINARWLEFFDETLIGGTEQPVDLEDLKKNTVYRNADEEHHPVIQRFWRVVSTFNEVQRQKLLKFATSCPRSPLMGFSYLSPKFSVQINDQDAEDNLPTASTCVNLLRLAPYSTDEILKKKLLYAINAQAGFDLS